jgi:hypothetical protein
MRGRFWIALLVGLSILLVGCAARSRTVETTDDVQRIGPERAKELLDANEAALYDVRSANAYRSQHAAGAESFPEGDVDASYDSLPDDKALIFY